MRAAPVVSGVGVGGGVDPPEHATTVAEISMNASRMWARDKFGLVMSYTYDSRNRGVRICRLAPDPGRTAPLCRSESDGPVSAGLWRGRPGIYAG